ncbi:MAG: M17 family metallopeptidase [Fluviibacter sp.]
MAVMTPRPTPIPTATKKPAVPKRKRLGVLPDGWQPVLPRVSLETGKLKDSVLNELSHTLVLFPASLLAGGQLPAGLPGGALLKQVLGRQRKKPGALLRVAASAGKMPVEPVVPAASLPGGGLIGWLAFDPDAAAFLRHQQLRQALSGLLAEQPEQLNLVFHGSAGFVASALPDAAYVAVVNRVGLPKTVAPDKAVKTARNAKPAKAGEIRCWVGTRDQAFLKTALNTALVKAEANILTRALCVLPPNQLTPGSFRALIPAQIKGLGIRSELYDVTRLQKMKAGAFLAVAQGSPAQDAAIVHLSYVPKIKPAKPSTKDKAAVQPLPYVSLIGKGICFDTGGHNLKPARYMAGMHEDMAGAAVALSVIQAAARLQLPVRIDAWLALSRNDIAPGAYCQGDVVTSLNGQTIEIVHTDAEGRMVLADTLALAAGKKPDAMIDFATLTGSMTTALGNRMSGFFASQPQLASRLADAGAEAGERLLAFAMPDDYDHALESQVADIKQCTLDGEADHILAARFLNLFVGDAPWLHVDLSAATCKGGLGAVSTDTTGFGAALTLHWLQAIAAKGFARQSAAF